LAIGLVRDSFLWYKHGHVFSKGTNTGLIAAKQRCFVVEEVGLSRFLLLVAAVSWLLSAYLAFSCLKAGQGRCGRQARHWAVLDNAGQYRAV
jgi:hypothetical protein